jgi:hypothetical protein
LGISIDFIFQDIFAIIFTIVQGKKARYFWTREKIFPSKLSPARTYTQAITPTEVKLQPDM